MSFTTGIIHSNHEDTIEHSSLGHPQLVHRACVLHHHHRMRAVAVHHSSLLSGLAHLCPLLLRSNRLDLPPPIVPHSAAHRVPAVHGGAFSQLCLTLAGLGAF